MDHAFDFREKIEISPKNILLKIPVLKEFENQIHQPYKTTLYIQNQMKDSYQLSLIKIKKALLQKICIYDKSIKNSLKIPLTRFEFRVWIDCAID